MSGPRIAPDQFDPSLCVELMMDRAPCLGSHCEHRSMCVAYPPVRAGSDSGEGKE